MWCWTFLRDKHKPVTHVHTLSLLMHAYNLHLPTHTLKHQQLSQSQRRGGRSQSEPIWLKHSSLQHMCKKEIKRTGGPSYSTMLGYNYSADIAWPKKKKNTKDTFNILNCLKANRVYDSEHYETVSQHTPQKKFINVVVMTFHFQCDEQMRFITSLFWLGIWSDCLKYFFPPKKLNGKCNNRYFICWGYVTTT